MPAAGNAEETKQRILDAAMAEFAAYGVAGARVDRIAKAADCNKNLIYIYFTNKESLFVAVLQQNLPRIYDDLKFDPADLPDFARRVFDFAQAHPVVMRLLAWTALEMPPGAVPARDESRQERLAEIEQAQAAGRLAADYPPWVLLTVVLSLATAWSAMSPFVPSESLTPKEIEAIRQSLVQIVAAVVGG